MFQCQVSEAMMTEVERRWRPSTAEVAPSCPRCASANTKFCYYNNYSLSQPRYFCKACRRYWTKGGSLRNVPVGGGSRKTRRSKHPKNTSKSTSSAKNLARDSPDSSSGDSNIDLAAVFANYLNSAPPDQEPAVSGEKASEPDSEDLGFVGDVMMGDDSMTWWQPMAHLQDVEASLMSDSVWSGFDIPGFEIFSRS